MPLPLLIHVCPACGHPLDAPTPRPAISHQPRELEQNLAAHTDKYRAWNDALAHGQGFPSQVAK